MNNLKNDCIIYKNSYILTKNGYYIIEDLDIDNPIEIWNGENWILTNIKQNINPKDNIVYKLLLSDGCEIFCSNLQSLNIAENINSNSSKLYKLESIKLNDLLYTYNFPIIDSTESILYSYTHGYYCGCLNKTYKTEELLFESNLIYINLIDDKQKLKSKIEITGKYSINKSKNITTGLLKMDMDNTIKVPINSCIENKLLWLSGLIDNNGFITKLCDAKYLNINVLTKKFAMEIKFLFNTLGINPQIHLKTDIRKLKLESGDINEIIKTSWVITLDSEETNKLFLEFDLKLYYLEYNKKIYSIDQTINRYLSIKKINKIQLKKESYILENINSCIVNGVLVYT